MDKNKLSKHLGTAVDILMFAILIVQMTYVFVGNTVHELLGIGFFLCLVCHIVLKRRQILAIFKKRQTARSMPRLISDCVTVALFACCIALMLSSMGVSRMIFPWFKNIGSASLHRYLATATLTLSVIHGGMKGYMRTKKKKRAVILIALGAAAALALGLAGVPYLNRHFKKVEISYSEKVSGEKLEWNGKKTLVVYFTRIGNTDFEPDVDAVSGASLLLADGRLMGNTQLMADMLSDIAGFERRAITLTGEKYPSGYSSTISVASKELKEDARPGIEPIDVSGYEQIILVYPIWWFTLPAPVATFLEQTDLSGKTVYLLATQGSSGFGSSTEDARAMAHGAEFIEGLSIYCDDIPDSRAALKDWLAGING